MDNEIKNEQDYRQRKIYRSRKDRIVFGVCGGIAEYYNIESLWVRVVFIFLGITGAIGFILYISLAILMSLNPEKIDEVGKGADSRVSAAAGEFRDRVKGLAVELRDDPKIERRRNLLGLLIVSIGIIAFFNELFPNFWIGWKVLWPIIIILIGFSFISNARPNK
jgi:phage shock protein PspC (stress-responsive transcriptional regulator)